MLRVPRTLAFAFIAAGVAIACSSSNSAAPGSSSGGTKATSSSGSTSSSGATTVPCGGAGEKACGGTGCKTDADCASGTCDSTGKCTTPLPPSATDGKKDGTETDVDCGGDAAPPCADTKDCDNNSDCTSGVCNQTCQVPTSTDKVRNGDETDVDCGGSSTHAPPCATGLMCKVHADCASDGCDDTGHCALERSCTQTNGGLTCGSGEVGDANASHESCCVSLPIPGMTTRLDKYKVTAGRMRAFIERTNGDVQGWYASAKATLSPAAVAQLDPVATRLPKDLDSTGGANNGDGSDGDPAGAKIQLGGTSIYTDRPSDEQGCYTGNANEQDNGAHTYFTDNEGEVRGFDQAFLDRLTLNCVPEPLAAAFCAWDGGRLQTWEENSAAFGADDYPWGTSPTVGGFGGDDFHSLGPAQYGATEGPCDETDTTCRHDWMNWSSDYQNPEGGNPNIQYDYAYFISPPGRFPHDKGPGGHMDIGGLMMELTASPGTTTDPEYGAKVRWSRAGSWEGHQVNYTGWEFALMTKYGKTGARCARD